MSGALGGVYLRAEVLRDGHGDNPAHGGHATEQHGRQGNKPCRHAGAGGTQGGEGSTTGGKNDALLQATADEGST